jgi:two-component system, NtrC family, sensor kinase
VEFDKDWSFILKLSIRTKILGGYSFAMVIFVAIIANVILAQSRISLKLKTINEDFLPKLNKVNSLPNYAHLDDSLEVSKLVQNRKNKILVQNIAIYHPRLFLNQLTELEKSVNLSIENLGDSKEKRSLNLVLSSINEVKKRHTDYVSVIQSIASDSEKGEIKAALKQGELLARRKAELKSEIVFLRRRVDNSISSSFREIATMEKSSSIVTGALSLLAITIAGIITLVALYTLAPIKRLIEGVKKISMGDYNHKVEIKSEGEMKKLSIEFNKMSESILERNRALQEQQKKLIQSERMATVGAMASHITHEIKNPLNSISLNTELLEDEVNSLKALGNTDEAFKLLGSIRREIERLSKITEEYLSFARLPKGERRKIHVEEILKDLTGFMKEEFNKHEIEVVENYIPVSPLVFADPNQLKQAFMNILKNAIEAMESPGKIVVSTSYDRGKIKIFIEDSGKGIAADVLDHIFDPFFSTKAKGTGLGLPLTQKLINEQGGEITCVSEPGKFTRFEITLPELTESVPTAHA